MNKTIIELNTEPQHTEPIKATEYQLKENIINFELFKKYNIIVITC